MTAVPVFEAKNKLPYYLHKAETEGPVLISRHNQDVAYIISKEDFLSLQKRDKTEKSIVERFQERRKEYGLENDDFDYPAYFDSLRVRNYSGRPDSEHIFDEV